MSPNELDKALEKLGTLHREINRLADLEAKAAEQAGGQPVPENPAKVHLVAKGEQILNNILAAWKDHHRGS